MSSNIGFSIFFRPAPATPKGGGEITAVFEILDVGFHSHPAFQVA